MKLNQKFVKTRIVSTEAISILSAEILNFALPIIAINNLKSGNTETGMIHFFYGLGTLIFLIFFNWTTDLKRKDLLLGGISLLRGLITTYISYELFKGEMTINKMFVCIFFISGATAIYESSFSAYLPVLVNQNELPKMNSWIAGLRAVADIGTGSVAGLILAQGGTIETITAISILYFIASIGPFSFIKKFALHDQSSYIKNIEDPYSNLKSSFIGLRILIKDPIQRTLNISIVHFNFFTAAIAAMYIVYSINYANMSELQVGISGTISGIIGLSGVYFFNLLVRKLSLKKILGFSLLFPGIIIQGLVFLPFLPNQLSSIILGLSLGIWSASVLINISAFETIKQKTIPEQYLGRYSAASRLITWGIDPLGAAFGATSVVFIPLGVFLFICSLGLATSCIWVFRCDKLK